MNACMEEINVQTTLPEVLYQSLWRIAKAERRPLKAVVREAIESYVRESSPTAKDPLMGFLGTGKLKESDWSIRKDWRA